MICFIKITYNPDTKNLIMEFHDDVNGVHAFKSYDSLPFMDAQRMHEDAVMWTKDGRLPRFCTR